MTTNGIPETHSIYQDGDCLTAHAMRGVGSGRSPEDPRGISPMGLQAFAHMMLKIGITGQMDSPADRLPDWEL